MKILRIFWPIVLYALLFGLYYLAVKDFYHPDGFALGLFALYIPCLIACVFALPSVAMGQLAYGTDRIVKAKRRDGWLHIYSSLSMFGLSILFVAFVSAGNYATV